MQLLKKIKFPENRPNGSVHPCCSFLYRMHGGLRCFRHGGIR